jgi:hypothetical protein
VALAPVTSPDYLNLGSLESARGGKHGRRSVDRPTFEKHKSDISDAGFQWSDQDIVISYS